MQPDEIMSASQPHQWRSDQSNAEAFEARLMAVSSELRHVSGRFDELKTVVSSLAHSVSKIEERLQTFVVQIGNQMSTAVQTLEERIGQVDAARLQSGQVNWSLVIAVVVGIVTIMGGMGAVLITFGSLSLSPAVAKIETLEADFSRLTTRYMDHEQLPGHPATMARQDLTQQQIDRRFTDADRERETLRKDLAYMTSLHSESDFYRSQAELYRALLEQYGQLPSERPLPVMPRYRDDITPQD